jgi:adenylate kinase
MTIFVAGMHGVGKTYLAKPASQRLGLHYATASQLIREERGAASWNSNKRVDEIDENQRALIIAVSRIRAAGMSLLLDGHFVLRGADSEPVPLPPEVFRELGCRGVVLLEADIERISQRLQARRDSSWELPEIARFVTQEREHAENICSRLDIPYKKIELATPAGFDAAVSMLLSYNVS